MRELLRCADLSEGLLLVSAKSVVQPNISSAKPSASSHSSSSTGISPLPTWVGEEVY